MKRVMARILYFAQLVDRVGKSSEELPLPPEVTTVRALLTLLRTRGPDWRQALADDAVRVTVNRQLATLDTPISDKQEIGLLSTVP
jgi:molybdopterin synthase sulfur carrier subunit